ncbi:MAG: hypothetical protein K9G24_01540 [Candidatus Nanopelagicales bacterium]|nr:hypothetical protein [Candidatus Nanopelagicales bacterium]MCF8541743.1 hypothetical protein [Candidatus Nanopelagicales bacterium]MCF8556036.1 hypothetical protein [Candidatus Nanopelagicales bacterium]
MRRALVVLASLGLGLGAIALATPAQAASSITDNGDGSVTVALDPNDAVYFCSSSTAAGACGPSGGGL